MFSLHQKVNLRCGFYSNDDGDLNNDGDLLIGHTDVLSRTEEQGGRTSDHEVSQFCITCLIIE